MSKCVVIGVTGGIAVYKALDVISALRKKDIEVHVIWLLLICLQNLKHGKYNTYH